MNYRVLLPLLGLFLITLGIVGRGWFLLAIWPGLNFLILGIAHAGGRHGVFGKRADGTLPFWSWLVFAPLLVLSLTVWHALRFLLREPAHNQVNDQLSLGRRLSASEFLHGFDNYVDLTAEFCEPGPFRGSAAYFSFPILDGAAPSADRLLEAVNKLRPGKTFVHCAQGHGRGGLFALAVLLKSGAAKNVDEAVAMLKAARPAMNLTRPQKLCLEEFHRKLKAHL